MLQRIHSTVQIILSLALLLFLFSLTTVELQYYLIQTTAFHKALKRFSSILHVCAIFYVQCLRPLPSNSHCLFSRIVSSFLLFSVHRSLFFSRSLLPSPSLSLFIQWENLAPAWSLGILLPITAELCARKMYNWKRNARMASKQKWKICGKKGRLCWRFICNSWNTSFIFLWVMREVRHSKHLWDVDFSVKQ